MKRLLLLLSLFCCLLLPAQGFRPGLTVNYIHPWKTTLKGSSSFDQTLLETSRWPEFGFSEFYVLNRKMYLIGNLTFTQWKCNFINRYPSTVVPHSSELRLTMNTFALETMLGYPAFPVAGGVLSGEAGFNLLLQQEIKRSVVLPPDAVSYTVNMKRQQWNAEGAIGLRFVRSKKGSPGHTISVFANLSYVLLPQLLDYSLLTQDANGNPELYQAKTKVSFHQFRVGISYYLWRNKTVYYTPDF